jgi:hypothetical protein
MAIDPSRTRSVRAEDVKPGDAVVVNGVDVFIVREIRPGGPTGRLALLLWDDLALLLRRGATRTVLIPPGERHADRTAGRAAGTYTERPAGPALPLAG